ncbi:hypothetical protein EH220_05695, partial [bacterium]
MTISFIRPALTSVLTWLMLLFMLMSSAFANPETARSAADLPSELCDQNASVFHGRPLSSNLDEIIISENFNSRIFPPEGWTIQTLNTNHPTYTWFAQDYLSPVNPHDPPFNAGVLWDSTGALQDEWLISPAFSLPEAPPPDSVHPISWDLSFKWMMSYYWGVFPHDNYDLELRLSLDGGANFNTVLWTEDSVTTATFNNFEWYTAAVDMVEFANNPNARLAWRYSGEGGAEAGIDVVSLSVPRDIIPIPDNGTASWPIEVATPDIIEDLDITLNVTHPYISDMSFAL